MNHNLFQHFSKVKFQGGLVVLTSSLLVYPLVARADTLTQFPQVTTHNSEEALTLLLSDVQDTSTANLTINPLPILSASKELEEPAEERGTQLASEQNFEEDVSDLIKVKKFRFQGATVFKQERLEKVVAKFLQEVLRKNPPSSTNITELSFAQLLLIRSAITQLYIDAGYITSGAYIPTQTFNNAEGVVTIAIVEGKPLAAEHIQVKPPDGEEKPGSTEKTNIPKYKLNYVCLTSQIARSLVGQEVLNQKPILDALRVLLASEPRIEIVNAKLEPGQIPGTNKLNIEVTEKTQFPFSYDTQLAIDNSQSPSIGSIRGQLQLNANNLLKPTDIWSVAYSKSEGSDAIDASVTLPLRESNGCSNETLIVRGGNRWNNIVERPFNQLDIESNGQYLDATMRWATHPTVGEERAWSITGSWQKSSSSLLNDPFPLSFGANDRGITEVLALRVGREWRQRNNREVSSRRLELSFGSNVAMGDTFVLLRGGAEWGRILSRDTILLARANVQLTDNALPALEQLGVGGQGTVRGYRNNYLLSDNGFLGSVELQLPILRLAQQSTLKLIPFLDFGIGWNSSDQDELNLNTNTLWSTGLGLQYQLGDDRLTARLDWGIPLVSVKDRGDSLQDEGVYFSVRWNPF